MPQQPPATQAPLQHLLPVPQSLSLEQLAHLLARHTCPWGQSTLVQQAPEAPVDTHAP